MLCRSPNHADADVGEKVVVRFPIVASVKNETASAVGQLTRKVYSLIAGYIGLLLDDDGEILHHGAAEAYAVLIDGAHILLATGAIHRSFPLFLDPLALPTCGQRRLDEHAGRRGLSYAHLTRGPLNLGNEYRVEAQREHIKALFIRLRWSAHRLLCGGFGHGCVIRQDVGFTVSRKIDDGNRPKWAYLN
jgi:hypothetical protein